MAVFGERRGDRLIRGGQGPGLGRGGLTQPGGQGGITEHRAHRRGEVVRVAPRDKDRGVLPEQTGVPADPCSHDRHPGPDRLLQDERLAFPHAGQHEHVRGGQQRRHIAALADEPHGEPERGRLGLELGRERSLASNDEQRLGLDVTPAGGSVEQEAESLLRGQPTDGQHDGLARLRPEFGAERRACRRGNVTRQPDGRGGHHGVTDPACARGAHPVL